MTPTRGKSSPDIAAQALDRAQTATRIALDPRDRLGGRGCTQGSYISNHCKIPTAEVHRHTVILIGGSRTTAAAENGIYVRTPARFQGG